MSLATLLFSSLSYLSSPVISQSSRQNPGGLVSHLLPLLLEECLGPRQLLRHALPALCGAAGLAGL